MKPFEPTLQHLQEVADAREDRVDLIPLEKDWHLVQIFALLQRFAERTGARYVFIGGTSLSKRGLISRFSEDADFLIVTALGQMPSRRQRSDARKALVAAIEEELAGYSVKLSRSFDAGYQQLVEIHYPTVSAGLAELGSLRPHIRLEMRYVEGPVEATVLDVRSLVNETLGAPAEVKLEALSPVVIAANKLVGLAWRVVRRDEGKHKEQDRNLVRHVHDLAALESTIRHAQSRFRTLVAEVIEGDRPRYADLSVGPDDLLTRAPQLLATDALYRREYERFVSEMSYAPIDELIPADDAFAAYRRIVDIARA